MEFRRPAYDFGLHRVLAPEGALPQAADRLDAGGPAFANEIAIDVDRLNIDSASFHQISEDVGGEAKAIGRRVIDIVDERGKMQNPVTGSGGMLLGTIGVIGPDYDGPVELAVGDRVATLVSLTLTPLHLDHVRQVVPSADQVVVDGRAYLPSSAPVVVLPEDFEEPVALSIFDVCGAPAQTRRLAEEASSVLVLGAGKSGVLSATAARDAMGEEGSIYAVDLEAGNMEELAEAGILDDFRTADATRPNDVRGKLRAMHGSDEVDLVLNNCNVPGTEMSAILPCRERGTVYFFNMATSFSRAALGAEGAGKDVDLLIGNGYATGHAEYAIDVVRRFPTVRELFA